MNTTKQNQQTTKPNKKEYPPNPLREKHEELLSTIPTDVKENLFSPKVPHEKRAEILTIMSEEGESLVNQYSWAIPNEKCLNILNHFAPIIEIGCGKNAYWSNYMFDYGIDVIAYDIDLEEGGQINHSSYCKDNEEKSKKQKMIDSVNEKRKLCVLQGGPEVLTSDEFSDRTLFLCYPDEEQDEDGSSLGISCLTNYKGKYVIHVGELYGSHTLSIDQAPYGRSSGCDFQDYLNTYFHCLLNMRIPNWVHVNDTISVWKRSELCTVVYADDDDEGVVKDSADDEVDEDDIAEYKYIPVEERLPVDVAAPCVSHLLKFEPEDDSKSSKMKK